MEEGRCLVDERAAAANMKSKNRKALSSCLFVLNTARSPRKARRLARLLKAAGAPPPVHAGSIADFRSAVRSFPGGASRHLIVFGGDGTVSEALNVLFEGGGAADRLRGKALGFIRGGSGNGYHDSYGVPVPLGRQIAAIGESVERNLTMDVDLLKVEAGGRVRLGQLVGLGFDARVLARRAGLPTAAGASGERTGTPGSLRAEKGETSARSGLAGYVAAFLGAFAALRRPITAAQEPLTLSATQSAAGGERGQNDLPRFPLRTRAPMIEIGKRPYYGNRFKVCPGAVPDDGRMETVLFNFDTKLSVLLSLIPLWAGWHRVLNRRGLNRRGRLVEHFRAERVLIESEAPIAFHVDGELPPPGLEARSLSISVLPGAVSFLVPRRLCGAVSRAVSNRGVRTA